MIEHAARHSTSLARSDCKRVAYALGDRRPSRVEASFHYSLRCRRGHKEAFWRRFGLERCEVQELSEGPAYRVAAWHLGERPPLVFVNYIPRVTGQPSPALLRTRKQRLAAGNRYLGKYNKPASSGSKSLPANTMVSTIGTGLRHTCPQDTETTTDMDA